MFKNDIISEQAILFNKTLNDDQLNYIVSNSILIYADFANINYEEPLAFLLEEINWVYDENNNRIPYLNETKINQIKINEDNNLYDYISSSRLINNYNIIFGEKFLSLCDVFIGSINSINANPSNRYIQKNIFDIKNNIKDVINKYDSIFVKTDDLPYFYSKIFSNNINLNNKIIVTHNSDFEIDSNYKNILNNVKKQLSQNCLITHKNLEPIPIGIENTQWFDHQIFHKIRMCRNIKKEKEIYFYFSLTTHFSRNECYEKLKNKLIWNSKLSKEEYFIELKKHKFAICPRGNGLDTHRIWECLYLDVIPIMLKKDCINIDNLPIIYLNDWDELDINNINKKFTNMQFSKTTIEYYKQMLYR
jgi:hypothetical protein